MSQFDLAEMRLDGRCCGGCGRYMGDSHGTPRYCTVPCAEAAGVVVEPRRVRLRPVRTLDGATRPVEAER